MFGFDRSGWTAILIGCLCTGVALAQGEVSEVELAQSFATPSAYSIGEQYYRWGSGVNLAVTAFSLQGRRFVHRYPAGKVLTHRVDNATVSGEGCSLFAELGRRPLSYQPDFPGNAAGICAPDRLLRQNIVNRGLLDVFANVDDGDLATAGNIERIDVLFPEGILSPVDAALLDDVGFLIAEKGGNSHLKLAAITGLDAAGQPATFAKLVEIEAFDAADPQALRYGLTDLILRSDFLANTHEPPNGPPVSLDAAFVESLGAVFVSLKTLGMTPGQVIYGYSLFGADVDETTDLLDPASFPLDTGRRNQPDAQGRFGGDADLYGGIAAYYTSTQLMVLQGTVFRDADASGQQDAGEDGIAGLPLRLYRDDGDGRFDVTDDLLVAERRSDATGGYRFTTLPAGRYWLFPDRDAEVFPQGYEVAGAPLPRLITLSADMPVQADFPLVAIGGSEAALLARNDRFFAMAGQALLLDVLANDRIPDSIMAKLGVTAQPAQGSLRRIGNRFVYTPNANANGVDGFTYRLQGRSGEVSTASVRIELRRPGSGDSDLDGLADVVDPDDDNDAIPDYAEGAGDSDGDGIIDQLDPDADGDGIFDLLESGLSADEIRRRDANGDGRIDTASLAVEPIERWRLVDTDGDGRPDYLDLDSDDDGIADVIEAGFDDADFDGRADGSTRFRLPHDSDGDGIADFRELDADADGLFDIVEAGLTDVDGDGRIDGRRQAGDGSSAVFGDDGSRNLDADGNGVPDFQEVTGHKLRVGLTGWGGGVVSPLWLLMLLISGSLKACWGRYRLHGRKRRG